MKNQEQQPEWMVTDASTGQQGRKLTEFTFEFKEGDQHEIIDLRHYDNVQTESIISAYGHSLTDIDEKLGEDANWIIAECIFETIFPALQQPKEVKHTEGELSYKHSNVVYESNYFISSSKSNFILASVHHVPNENEYAGIGKAEAEANAKHLVKCWNMYPELVEAMKHVLNNLEQESEEVFEHEIAHLKHALRKAGEVD